MLIAAGLVRDAKVQHIDRRWVVDYVLAVRSL
jgi:hypothetical protein